MGCKLQEPGQDTLFSIGKMCKTGHWAGACESLRAYANLGESFFAYVFLMNSYSDKQASFESASFFLGRTCARPFVAERLPRGVRS